MSKAGTQTPYPDTVTEQNRQYGSAIASFDWKCPYCGTRSDAYHALDCQRNSVENLRLAQAYGTYGMGR